MGGISCSTQIATKGKVVPNSNYSVSSLNCNGIESEYQLGKKMTQRVREVKNKITGIVYVCYELRKADTPLSNGSEVGRSILKIRELDHPNLALLLEGFDDQFVVQLIYEHVQCCHIHEWYKKQKSVTEQQVSKIVKQLVRVVSVSEQQEVNHGCLTPKNIFIHSETNRVVVTDMGLANTLKYHPLCCFSEWKDKETICYMAPELVFPWALVYRHEFNEAGGFTPKETRFPLAPPKEFRTRPESDMWSVGCILFELLTGKRFVAKTKTASLDKISGMKGKPEEHMITNLAEELARCTSAIVEAKLKPVGKKVGTLAMDALNAMLHIRVEFRGTSEDLMKLPFFKDTKRLSTLPMAKEVLQNVCSLIDESAFKRFMMMFVSMRMPTSKCKGLEDIFNAVDTSGNGFLDTEELQAYANKFPDVTGNCAISSILEQLDRNGSKTISLREFIAATLDQSELFSDGKILMAAFKDINKNKDGMVTHDELSRMVREIEARAPKEDQDQIIYEICSEVPDGMKFAEFQDFLHREGNAKDSSSCCELAKRCPGVVHTKH